ncbi:hypothetical protein Tco_0812584 [Tanacetum coccineum]
MGLESLEARIVVHEKNEAVYEEDIAFLKYDVQVKDISIKDLKNYAKGKAGLCYDSQMNESEVVHSVFNSRESNVDDSPVNDRFKTGGGFQAVPPPYTRNYMPSRPDLSFVGLDNSVYKTKVSETKTSIFKTSKDIVGKPKTVRPSAPIIEDWDTDRSRPDWLFDIDLITNSMIYELVTAWNQTNKNEGIKDNTQQNILLPLLYDSPKSSEDAVADDAATLDNLRVQQKEGYANITNRDSTVSPSISAAGQSFTNVDDLATDPLMPDLEDTTNLLNTGIFSGAYDDDDDVGAEANLNNLEISMNDAIRVEKALYGLHQAPKAWYETLSTYLLEIGIRRGIIDKTLFIKKTKVIPVMQRDNGIFISQDKYVADILKKFDFSLVKTTSTPIETNCNTPILIDISRRFVDQHNMVACLEKSEGNADFHEIVDFLTASSVHYALTQIHATVDGKTVVISESSVRSDLHFNDEDGITCLTNDAIFENLTLMGYESDSNKLTFQKSLFSPQWKYLIHTILHCLSSKSTFWNEFSTNIASAVICLANGQKFNFSKLIFDGMLRNLDTNTKKFLMYPRFLQLFLNNQITLVEPFNDVYQTPAHTKKVFTNMKRKGKYFLGRVTPLFASMLAPPVVEGEGSGQPSEPQPTPSTAQPRIEEQIPVTESSSPQNTQSPRQALQEDTQFP